MNNKIEIKIDDEYKLEALYEALRMFVDELKQTNQMSDKKMNELKELLSSFNSVNSNIKNTDASITKTVEILTQIVNKINILEANNNSNSEAIKENKEMFEKLLDDLKEFRNNIELQINTKLDKKLESYNEVINNMTENAKKSIDAITTQQKDIVNAITTQAETISKKIINEFENEVMNHFLHIKATTSTFLENLKKEKKEMKKATTKIKIGYITSFVVGVGIAGFVGFSIGYHKTFEDIQRSVKTNIQTVQNIASTNAVYTSNGLDVGIDDGKKVVIVNKKAHLCNFNNDYNEICY